MESGGSCQARTSFFIVTYRRRPSSPARLRELSLRWLGGPFQQVVFTHSWVTHDPPPRRQADPAFPFRQTDGLNVILAYTWNDPATGQCLTQWADESLRLLRPSADERRPTLFPSLRPSWKKLRLRKSTKPFPSSTAGFFENLDEFPWHRGRHVALLPVCLRRTRQELRLPGAVCPGSPRLITAKLSTPLVVPDSWQLQMALFLIKGSLLSALRIARSRTALLRRHAGQECLCNPGTPRRFYILRVPDCTAHFCVRPVLSDGNSRYSIRRPVLLKLAELLERHEVEFYASRDAGGN